MDTNIYSLNTQIIAILAKNLHIKSVLSALCKCTQNTYEKDLKIALACAEDNVIMAMHILLSSCLNTATM